MPSYDVVVKTTAAQLVLSKRIVVPTNDQVPAYLDKAYAELGDYAARNGVKQIGPNLTLWYTPSDVFSNEEVEVAIPIDRSLPSQGDLVCRELPSVEVAAAVHQGDFAQFQQLYPSLLSWISDRRSATWRRISSGTFLCIAGAALRSLPSDPYWV